MLNTTSVEHVDDSVECDNCTYATWFNSKNLTSVARAKVQLAEHKKTACQDNLPFCASS
jgi:hypothetical protein